MPSVRSWYTVTPSGPAGVFPLAPDEIRLWCCAVGCLPPEALTVTLPAFEQERSPSLHFATGRWLLRQVLGGLLGREPQSLRLAHSPTGKPYLPDSPLRFNLTHSRSLVLLAVTRDREVGIDVEWTGRPVAIARLAQRFFEDSEQRWLKQYGSAAFWPMWTCKEARAKLRGEALGSHLRFPTVPILEAWQAGQLTVTLDYETFAALSPQPDYVATLAWQEAPAPKWYN